MAAQLRLRGQEVEIRIIRGGTLEDTIVAIGNFTETFKLEKKEDGFLGEPTNRYDDIFNGIDGDLEFQVTNQEWIKFQEAVKERAQRKNPLLTINIVRTDLYANGDTPVYTYKDAKFGAQPTTIASRGDFVKVKVDFSCSERDVALS